MEFKILSIENETPMGYRLATFKEAEENYSEINSLFKEETKNPMDVEINYVEERDFSKDDIHTFKEEVRLKDGYLTTTCEVRQSYKRGIKRKLVRTSSSSPESHVVGAPADKEETATPQSQVADDTIAMCVDEPLLISLTYACEHDDVTEVEELLEQYKVKGGLGIFRERLHDRCCATMLHVCAKHGSVKTLDMLLKSPEVTQFQPSQTDSDGDTPLGDAAGSGEIEATKLLLDTPFAKDMLNVSNNYGQTPLLRALDPKICNLILEKPGVELDKDKQGYATLCRAVKNGYADVVKAILDYPGAKDLNLPNQPNSKDETPLHLAASMGHKEICLTLLENGASMELQDKTKNTPLQLALDNDDPDVAYTFLKFRKDDSPVNQKSKKHGRTFLHVAASHQSPFPIYDLIKKGAFVDATNDDGETPLHTATIAGHAHTVDCFFWEKDVKFEHCMDRKQWVNKGDSSGDTALHIAARQSGNNESTNDSFRITKKLLRRGACVDLRNSDGETPLHLAVQKGNSEVVDLLLSKENLRENFSSSIRWNMYVSMCDFSGETPLHEAAREGREDVMKKLLKHLQPNDLVIRDIENRTALYWAVQQRTSNMMQLLLEHAEEKNADFLLWNLLTVHGSHKEDWPLKEEVMTKYRKRKDEKKPNLLEIAASFKGLDMAMELINKGDFDVQSLQQDESKIWLSENFCRKPSDRPALEDSLDCFVFYNGNGREKVFSERDSSLVVKPFTGTPLTIGIFGVWGMGKSSIMLQVEETLLRMAVNETFRKPHSNQQFLDSNDGTDSLLRFSSRGEVLRKQVITALKKLRIPKIKNQKNKEKEKENKGDGDLIGEILPIQYQSENRELIKHLALTNRSNLVTSSSSVNQDKCTTSTQSLEDAQATGQIPAVLTVRYNAWQYKNKTEASAGLAIEIIKEIENSMTPPQWTRMRWKYSWECQPKEIFMQLFLPLFLAIAAVCIMAILWNVVPIKTSYKALALPISFVGVSWVCFLNLMKVTKPIAQTILNYVKSPNHTSRLGYHQEVIYDIKFLMNQLCEEAYGWWAIVGFLGSFFIPTSYYMKDTRVRKEVPMKKNLRIMVFIDDLDRCDESTILELLSTINLILGTCGINVVVGIDKGMVENAITKSLLTDSKTPDNCRELAEKYIRKIIQLPIPLPEPSKNDLKSFIKEQIGKSSTQNDRNSDRHKKGTDNDECDNANKEIQDGNHSTLHGKQQVEESSRADHSALPKKSDPDATSSSSEGTFAGTQERSTLNDGKQDHHKEVAGKEVGIDIIQESIESSEANRSALEDKQQDNQLCKLDISKGHAISNNVAKKLDPNAKASICKGAFHLLAQIQTQIKKCFTQNDGKPNHHKEAAGNDEHENTKKPEEVQGTSLEDKQQANKAASSSKGAFNLLLANYSPLEVEMLEKLSEKVTGNYKSPREWKRFLNYHRLAWNILSQDPKMEDTIYKGWQRKLILWIFACWNWSEQMDIIIKNWDKLLYRKSAQAKGTRNSAEDVFSLGDVIALYIKGIYPEWKPNQEIPDAEDNIGSNSHADADMLRKMNHLYDTLKEDYDLRMEFIQVFQQFRVYSKLDHLEINNNMMKKSTKKQRDFK